MDQAVWLGGQALRFWIGMFPITFGLFVGVVVAVMRTRRRHEPLTARHAALLLPAAAIPLLLIAGGVFEDQPDYSPVVVVLLAAQIMISVGLVAAFKGTRLLALAVCLGWLWAALCCALVVQMSITGVWL